MSYKKYISAILRKSGLMEPLDFIRFLLSKLKYAGSNKIFKTANPGVALPPDFILYESFGKLNYQRYYEGGKETAEWLLDLIGKYYQLENIVICEWGCGPGRILRHLPGLLVGKNDEIIGTDYNRETIEWDKKNLAWINFIVNELAPPLPFEAESIDIIYCISVFTHLSEQMHYAWFEELIRVLKPDGIVLFTTHGNSFKDKLLDKERERYDQGKLVVRSHATEGKRTFTAFHSPDFIKAMIGDSGLLAHLEDTEPGHKYSQDTWIVRKYGI